MHSFPKKTACSSCSTMVGGSWRLAVGGWRLAVDNWWLVAVGGSWRRLVVGDWWLVAVGSGWWRLAVGRRWRLAAVGGWRLAVGGPLGRSLRAVLNKKNLVPKIPPCTELLQPFHQTQNEAMAHIQCTSTAFAELRTKCNEDMQSTANIVVNGKQIKPCCLSCMPPSSHPGVW